MFENRDLKISQNQSELSTFFLTKKRFTFQFAGGMKNERVSECERGRRRRTGRL